MYKKMNLRLFEDGNAGGAGSAGQGDGAGNGETPGQHIVMNRRKRLQTQGQAKRNVRHLPIISDARA